MIFCKTCVFKHDSGCDVQLFYHKKKKYETSVVTTIVAT